MSLDDVVIPWDDLTEVGQCWLCDELAFWRCDHGYTYQNPHGDCNRWVCPDHTTVEAQIWDTHGMDGVDMRCPAHCAPAGTVTIWRCRCAED